MKRDSSTNQPVRMKDIARDLGVSVVTVSKVLRDHSDISTATKRRVRKRIRELNHLFFAARRKAFHVFHF